MREHQNLDTQEPCSTKNGPDELLKLEGFLRDATGSRCEVNDGFSLLDEEEEMGEVTGTWQASDIASLSS